MLALIVGRRHYLVTSTTVFGNVGLFVATWESALVVWRFARIEER